MAERSGEEYLRMLQSLLPKGKAWSRDEDSRLTQFLWAIGDELSRIEGRVLDLLTERDTRYTTELITDHETDLGIPDSCSPLGDTLAERRAYANAKLIAIGRQNPAYYVELAATLGFTAYVTESAAGTFEWFLNVLTEIDKWIFFRSGDRIPKRISYYPGKRQLECLMEKFKPAHTIVQVLFYGSAFDSSFGKAFNPMAGVYTDTYLEGAFDRAFNWYSFDTRLGGAFTSAFGVGYPMDESFSTAFKTNVGKDFDIQQ